MGQNNTIVQKTTQEQRDEKKRQNAQKELDAFVRLLSDSDRNKVMNGNFVIVPHSEFVRMGSSN